MKILFIHQNMPGQYRELLDWLAAQGDHELVFLTQRKNAAKVQGVKMRLYEPHHKPTPKAYGLSKLWEEATGAGYGVALAAQTLERDEGFVPDLVMGHTGWGELLFLKQVWPDVPVLGFFELFYRLKGGIVGFDSSLPVAKEKPFMHEARNVIPYASLHNVDLGHCPTQWQADTFPEIFQDKFHICHDGIRTDLLHPNPDVSLTLGRVDHPLTREDEVFTYMARNLEYARGFHIFMRALPRILAARPNARVIVVGGDDVSYGRESQHPEGLRAELTDQLGDSVDWDRVHFIGQVPYSGFCKIVQLSRCHIALTMPFVMSWSLLESMAMQATIVTSDVAPIREAVSHGETGLLVDFFDHEALADQVIDVLANPKAYAHLGPAARAHVVERYDFHTRCLPEHIRRMNSLVPADRQIAVPDLV
jgi:glycosyltransferase involved in cell wall biosynthesis